VLVAFFFGFAMGFLGAIPVAGPIAAMVLERALDRRYVAALLLAAGSSVAEGFYAFLAVLGFAAVADRPWVAPASKLVAGLVLIAVGLAFALRRRPEATEDDAGPHAAPPRDGALYRQLLLGFTVTIVNPTLLATWAAATSMLVASEWVTLTPLTGVPFGLAVALGATTWFALVVVLVRRFTRHLRPSSVRRIIRGLGWGLVGLGGWFLILFVRAVA